MRNAVSTQSALICLHCQSGRMIRPTRTRHYLRAALNSTLCAIPKNVLRSSTLLSRPVPAVGRFHSSSVIPLPTQQPSPPKPEATTSNSAASVKKEAQIGSSRRSITTATSDGSRPATIKFTVSAGRRIPQSRVGSSIRRKVRRVVAVAVAESRVATRPSRLAAQAALARRRLARQHKQPKSSPKQPPPSKAPSVWADDSNISSFKPVSLPSPTPLTGLEQPPVARLEHGLDRVLFNPGVYRMQDYESRVFNFDPSLATLLDVKDFKFEALTPFKPPFRDDLLSRLAKTNNARYIASTSSLTPSLAHFHFLLSNWRTIDWRMLSRDFDLPNYKHSFTQIIRAPACADLRHKDGLWSLNSFASAEPFPETFVLSRLGHIVEKMLTQTPDHFDRFRKDNPFDFSETRDRAEHYHFAVRGGFLTRAQIDAYDPRLPGSGTFDIKSRAALPIRMSAMDPGPMLGYQITKTCGTFESFEREYHDMLRAIMLKYSLQVRLGNMNGIFVAYHNIQDVFGFQYISLSEMDLAMHGQYDRRLGDQELAASMHLLEHALDKVTAKFGKQDVRLWFETRPSADAPYMYICAQPMSEAEQGTDKDAWVALLETRSTWQGQPVARPGVIHQKTNSWKLQFKLTELSPERAAKKMAQVRDRRRRILEMVRVETQTALDKANADANADATAGPADKGRAVDTAMDMATAMSLPSPSRTWSDPMLEQCRRLSAKGRERRETNRVRDQSREPVVYAPQSAYRR